MVLERLNSPFDESPVPEVPLALTPLVSVLYQVRFPARVSKLERALEKGDLQDRLSGQYPYSQQQETFNLVIQPGRAAEPQPGAAVWTLQSADQAWTCSISPDSIALTTSAYLSRLDFVDRARMLLNAVEEIAAPPRADRVGVRYLNRVADPYADGGAWLNTLTHESQGILAVVSPGESSNIVSAISQVLYSWSSSTKLQCRWAVLPPQGLIDASMPPIPQPSWVLDIDAFREEAVDFSGDDISASIADLAQRAYRFFRWVLTPESLERFQPQEAT
jgi:uncharacterized protein (TIGR04255 family)